MDVALLFGERVRVRRLAKGLSQEALADASGLHRNYIGGIERGERNPSLVNICRLAGALACQPQELMADIPALPAKPTPG